ncbi:MAG: hypothetical protein DBX47_03325 [Clostridiales bacterium]|nr:MAG: hypothetical protein DBX47_03325 [Clostridiales bacterium]
MEKWLIIIFFIVLSLLLAATGVAYRKKSSTLFGFIAADRSFSFFTGASSSYSSVICGYACLVLMYFAYFGGTDGAQTAIFYGAALTIGMFLSWRFIGRRLRVYSELSSNTVTLPSFLESRFKDKTSTIKIVSSSAIGLFSCVYCSFMFTACAQLFSAAVRCSYSVALLICTVAVMIYLVFGGFFASVFTDVLQGFIFLIVIFFLPVYLFDNLDAGSRLLFENEFLQTLNLFKNGENFGINAFNSVFMMFGCFGLPMLFSRFVAMKDKKQIKRAKRFSPFPVAVCVILVVVIGLFLRQFPVMESKNAAVILCGAITDPFMKALTVSALLAAIMSASDSMLILMASVVGNDIYPLFRKKAGDEEKVTVARAATVVLTFCVCLISLESEVDIFSRLIQGFSGFASAFAPVLFFSLYSRRITLRAAVASIITGTLSTVILWFVPFPVTWIMPFCVCMILSTIVLWLVTLFDRKRPEKDILNEFSRVNEIMKLR